ncbi:DNA repair protein RecN [Defluviimonas aquaemixtae]|uniref:DNA repair protein RecN n=1 Tax=Albidovulum aquaemixtae TaxID=1542388 RepID=A0A2R8B2Z8_9RHOB|nr:DNA repair protein RecN [Defluviimonas aquaemixtae]SPH17006.1 DNA repair protein RecN [Defluviimonas aquaemixtae]
MLRSLVIRDMLIIDRLDLDFRPGLNVLTGETGAGKSILLDCLGFVMGWRGRAELVRPGAPQGEVTAVFDLPEGHAARAVLAEAGLETGDELILRRVNAADGRKTAWVNDRRTSGEVLRALSDTLVELHGQHDDRGLLNPRGHRQLLDAFAGVDLAPARRAWRARAAARKALAEAETQLAEMQTEEDFLRHAVDELDRLDPKAGEDAALDQRRRMMQAGQRIREDIARAAQALGTEGAEGLMSDAARWLDGAAEKAEGRLDEPIAALGRAITELGEAAQGVGTCLEALSFDPREMEAVEERLFAIRGLARKHAVLADDLGSLADELRSRLAALDGGAENIRALAEAADAASTNYDMVAAAIGAERRTAAKALDAAVSAELVPLKMDRAHFVTDLSEGEEGPEGRDQVAFTVATNPGAPPGPLNRIASGGELSRFLLALKVVLARGGEAVTMIFDEIDRGVGGATADAVGRRLARLAQSAQILVVTHSPQVAARGAHHWRVEKRIGAELTTSIVTPLAPDARVDELARMLSGENVTDAAREAARALLAG